MEQNFEAQKEHIIDELNKRAPNLKCPICSHAEFTLGGGYFAHDLQKALNERQIGGISIPAVPVICKNCGFVMEFAAGTLGLLPKPEESPKPESVEKHDEE